jgi:hypothetical protein
VGREALCPCRIGDETAEVKALLEGGELILRGALKRRYALASMTAVRVDGEQLCFTCDGETVALQLGAKDAARWAGKIGTPPPTLAEKLGIGAAHKAWLFGDASGAALAEALHGALAARPGEAEIAIVIATREAELKAALSAHAGMPQSRYLWVVHPKPA